MEDGASFVFLGQLSQGHGAVGAPAKRGGAVPPHATYMQLHVGLIALGRLPRLQCQKPKHQLPNGCPRHHVHGHFGMWLPKLCKHQLFPAIQSPCGVLSHGSTHEKLSFQSIVGLSRCRGMFLRQPYQCRPKPAVGWVFQTDYYVASLANKIISMAKRYSTFALFTFARW